MSLTLRACVCCMRVVSGHSLSVSRRSVFIRSTATSFLYDYCLRSQFFFIICVCVCWVWDESAASTYIAFAHSPLFNFEFRLEMNVHTLCSDYVRAYCSRSFGFFAEMNGGDGNGNGNSETDCAFSVIFWPLTWHRHSHQELLNI